MRASLKVPVLMALAVFGVSACGGDAESAPDLDSTEWEVVDGDTVAVDDLPEVEDAAATPPPASPPAERPRTPPAQETTPPPVEEPPVEERAELEEIEDEPVVSIPVGTRMESTVAAEVSTRTHEVGDRVRAVLSTDVVASDGSVVAPRGSHILGEVTRSERSRDSDTDAVLMLTFHTLEVGERHIPIRASIVDVDLEAGAGDSGTRTAAKIATGAAAGAIAGRILGGDRRSTAAGAAAGAAAGTGIALTTREGHAVLPEGAVVTVQIDEAAVVSGVR
ncbi:MAG: hypothetical protein EA352_05375 [Gemmatimonadales bacterium]|nr:MAG: hypothetical protein EA352_05375 [Gemmatimonadales bacterium]